MAAIPHWDHKKKVYQNMLDQNDYTVKTVEDAGKYIYCSLSFELMAELADIYYAQIHQVFKDKHRDYAEMVFTKLNPSFLGRQKDIDAHNSLLTEVGDSNNHLKNLILTQIQNI